MAMRAAASREVDAPAGAVFGFLADLDNHRRLARRYATVLELNDGGPDGAWVRVRGPLHVTRRARTEMTQAVAPANGVGGVIEGTATTPQGTEVRVTWRLSPRPNGTAVAVEFFVERATPFDRVLLAAGGRRWLERRFLRAALDDLSAAVVPGEL
jgi:hypothetical protein